MSQKINYDCERSGPAYQVGLVQWSPHDEIAQVFADELVALGHEPRFFYAGEALPPGIDVLLTHAPYGNLLDIDRKLRGMPEEERPVWAHWNTEGMPDPRLPWAIIRPLGALRSWLGRQQWLRQNGEETVIKQFIQQHLEQRALRLRYVGDYHYAYKQGRLHVLADSSEIYARIRTERGLPTIAVPWGGTPKWYANLQLERDIDVLWMGKRGSKRRRDLLQHVRSELEARGVKFYIADNEENPFIFGAERTRFLNRAKITLNIKRTWFDDNFSRFAIACPNRSLIVSETMLPHCSAYEPGVHYVSAPLDELADRIVHHLEHEDERERIIENAYDLTVNVIPFRKSVKRIIEAVKQAMIRLRS